MVPFGLVQTMPYNENKISILNYDYNQREIQNIFNNDDVMKHAVNTHKKLRHTRSHKINTHPLSNTRTLNKTETHSHKKKLTHPVTYEHTWRLENYLQ